jgi:molybdate-binding protein/DNA-binding XRE family transcriptional regulator
MDARVSSTSRIDDRLRLARLGRGLSQVALADQAGVTRQTISGIEAGRWSPSLDVALAIAAALSSSVEELFGRGPSFKPQEARLVAAAREQSRLLLASVEGEQVAFPLQGDHVLVPGFRPALAEMEGPAEAAAGAPVQAHRFVAPGPVLVIAGCDPALALLGGPLERQRPPVGLVWWNCGNATGVKLLDAGLAHVAAVHRRTDEEQGPSTAHEDAGFTHEVVGFAHEVVGFAAWREGLVVAPQYADQVTGLEDALALGLRLANREPGSEARRLLDGALADLGVGGARLPGYDSCCTAHLLVASAIAAGLADIGVASEPAALAYGLGFIPWQQEICELWIAGSQLGTPEVRALLSVLAGSELPSQLKAIAGYDATPCGRMPA